MTRGYVGRAPLAAMATLALVAGSCGGNSDDGGDARGKEPAENEAVVQTPPTTGTPREQIAATLELIHKAFKGKDAATVCAALSEDAQRQTAAGGRPRDTCEDVVGGYIDQFAANTTRPAELQSVRVKGDKAIVKVRTGETTVQRTIFVRTPDGWKSDEAIKF